VTTIPPNNTPSAESTDIDILEHNTIEAPNYTHMWTAEEWGIRNAPIARYDPWDQQTEPNNPWDYNINIVPDEERPAFFSAAVTTRSQRNAASAEPTRCNQGHNTLLSYSNPMRYVLGVGFMYPQYHTPSK